MSQPDSIRPPDHLSYRPPDQLSSIPTVRLSTWHLHQVVPEVSWIPNKHYSGVFGLLKLTLPTILPAGLARVIVLDTDVTFAADIGRLWAAFAQFGSPAALGLVENQSDWYIPGKLWKAHRPWPAIGRGFNTGVILMDLAKLRAGGWAQTWRLVAETDLVTMLSTSLADQDVFNAVVHRHPALLHRLPCHWNVQLSDNSLSDSLCYGRPDTQPVGAVHFNSPGKVDSDNRHVRLFRGIHLAFLQYDGNLLRGEVYNCRGQVEQVEQVEVVEAAPDPCKEFKAAGATVYRTHLYFLPHCPSNRSGEVALVTQLSEERLHMLVPLVERWRGPASLALYLSDPGAQRLLQLWQGSAVLAARCDVAYHVVYREGAYHPVNYLRNVALEQAAAAGADYVFLADIDFLPSPGMAASLATSAAALLAGRPRRALVVPALETHDYRPDGLPATKAEVVKRLDLGRLATFRQDDWPAGHRATNFPRWRAATQPYAVAWQEHFEPYLVVAAAVPRYDARFAGFGWNKVAHMMVLEAEGWQLVVLPDVFTVHLPHAPSTDLARFRGDQSYRTCLNNLKERFGKELEEKRETVESKEEKVMREGKKNL